MNPFQFPVCCEVCGEEGMGTAKTAGASYLAGYTVRHSDPRICAMVLKRKADALKKREDALNSKKVTE